MDQLDLSGRFHRAALIDRGRCVEGRRWSDIGHGDRGSIRGARREGVSDPEHDRKWTAIIISGERSILGIDFKCPIITQVPGEGHRPAIRVAPCAEQANQGALRASVGATRIG